MAGKERDRQVPPPSPRRRLPGWLQRWWRRYVLATTPRCIRDGEHDWQHECDECQSWW